MLALLRRGVDITSESTGLDRAAERDGGGFVDPVSKKRPAREDPCNEFKESYEYGRWAERLDGLDDNRRRAAENVARAKLRKKVAKAVCAIGNKDGGCVWLGIRDDGTVAGLERDMELLGFKDYGDSMANHITNSLRDLIKDLVFISSKISIGFRKEDAKTVCVIQILPSDLPLFLHDSGCKKFYVRGPAPRSEMLSGAKMKRYILGHFRVACDESGNVVEDLSDIIQEMDSLSRETISVMARTIRGTTIPFEDRVSEIEGLLAENRKVAVTGEKGSGKSVLLCETYERLAGERPAFFVRCDEHLGAESFDELDGNIMPGRSFVDTVSAVSRWEEPVVVFDSVDAISRNKKSMNALRDMLKKIWVNDKVRTVVSVRSHDYEYSPIMDGIDWGKEYRLEDLADPELDAVLSVLKNPGMHTELRRLVRNPFRLKLLSLILEKTPDADFTNVRHEAELYDRHWHECIEKTDRPAEIRDMLYRVAQKMTEMQRVCVPYGDFGDSELMARICSRNVLVRKHGQLEFFHHAYLDYVMSRLIIERGGVVKFVSDDEYNVFLRPTVVFALSLLHKRNPARFAGEVEQILRSDLKCFWKISTLTAVSQIDDLGGQDFSAIAGLLTRDRVLRGHFFREATKRANPLWFELWQSPYFEEWISDPVLRPDLMTNYMRSIKHVAKHVDIFRAVREIVKRSGNVPDQQNAVKLAAELGADGLAEWMSEMAGSEHAHVRTGVAKSLPRLLDACPLAVPGIFCSLFTYEEASREQTVTFTYGTLRMTGNRRQDNALVVWQLGQLFPELLEKDPELMMRVAIQLFEKIPGPPHQNQKNVIVDTWTDFEDDPGAKHKIAKDIKEYVAKCTEKELRRLAPIIRKTRLSVFRAPLLDAMVAKKGEFLQEIFDDVSDPRVCETDAMIDSVRAAIGGISARLDEGQTRRLLGTIMGMRPPNGKPEALRAEAALGRKAELLSAFPRGALKPEHLAVLGDIQERRSQGTVREFARQEARTGKMPKAHFRGGRGLSEAFVLRTLLDLLDGGADLEREAPGIRRLLASYKDRPEVAKDAAPDTVRGLAAECAVATACRYGGASLVPLVKDLSKDGANSVRRSVCKRLADLASCDYDLAYEIALEYSREQDPHVQFHVPDMIWAAADKDPAQASVLLENAVRAGNRSEPVVRCLLRLALIEGEPKSKSLLDRALGEPSEQEIRASLPFQMKQMFPRLEDQALRVFYLLLEDSDNDVRHKACLFLLASAEDLAGADAGLPDKIAAHLDLIASEVGREPCDPRLLEHLVRFLERFWERMPRKSLECLEKITRLSRYASTQPVFADGSVRILAGLLQQPLPETEARKCLDVLDTYAGAGWAKALDLLAAIEKRD